MEKVKPNLVRILEVSKVAPPPDSPLSAADFSLPFTYFDALFLKLPPTEKLFFYSLPDPPLSNSNSVISHLKHSLSLTLQHFLPLAGNLVWPPESPKPIILYSPGDAVSLTVAETDADFTHLSGTRIRPVEEFRHFVPELPATDDSVPVMALQITLFQNRGLSIGRSNHHAFVDGKSSIMFLKSWAHIFKHTQNKPESPITLPPELTPFFDRSIIKDPKGIDMLYTNYWLKKTNPTGPSIKSLKYFRNLGVSTEMVRGTFKFTRTDIENLRKSATKENESSNPSKKPTRLSSFVLAFAYISICAVKSARIEEKKKRVYLGFYADWRSRLDPAVPANYFGNCGGSHGVFAEAGELEDEEEGLGIASKRIDEAIKALNENVTEGAEESLSKWETVEEGIKFVGVVGSPRLGVYELDFGWGRPVKVVSIEKTGSISLADGRDGDGIEVGLVLSKPEILRFASIFSDGLKSL